MIFTEIECAECGIRFQVSAEYIGHRKENHQTFYCPSGHRNFFPGKSDSDLLREAQKTIQKLESEQNKRDDKGRFIKK